MVDQNSNDLKNKNDYKKPDTKQKSTGIQQEAQGQLSGHLKILKDYIKDPYNLYFIIM